MELYTYVLILLVLSACSPLSAAPTDSCRMYKPRQYYCINDYIRDILKQLPDDALTISLEHTTLNHINGSIFSRFRDLQRLKCRFCHIYWIDHQAFGHLPNLRYLELPYNILKSVNGDWFDDATLLEELDVSANPVSHVNNDLFRKATDLTKLTVAFTKLNCLNITAVSSAHNLQVIDISNNIIDEDCQSNLVEFADHRGIKLSIDSRFGQTVCHYMRKYCYIFG